MNIPLLIPGPNGRFILGLPTSYYPHITFSLHITLSIFGTPLKKKMFMVVFHLQQKTKGLPSGKRLHNYGKSPFPICKSTISVANS